jgi:conjugal transfer ATP-binding protein TraC
MIMNKVYKKIRNSILKSQFADKNNEGSTKPLQIKQANVSLERHSLSEYLSYSDFEDGMTFNVVGTQLKVGFGFHLGSLTGASDALAGVLANLFKEAPKNTVFQWGEFGCNDIDGLVDSWLERQTKYNKTPLLRKLNMYRAKMLKEAAFTPLHKQSSMFLRRIERYIFVTVPFSGDLESTTELAHFLKLIKNYQSRVTAILNDTSLSPIVLDRKSTHRIISLLLNPHIPANKLDLHIQDDIDRPLNETVTNKSTNAQIANNGDIIFDSGNDDGIAAVHMTIDKMPKDLHLYQFGGLTGDTMNRDHRINQPYFFYTTIHVEDDIKAKENIEASLTWLTKQTMSQGPKMRALIPHLYDRVNDSKDFIKELSEGQSSIRMYSGIVLYCDPVTASMDAEGLQSRWSNHGFTMSRERHIALPAFLASLPYQYNYEWDRARAGLMRARLAKSINAASASLVVGDWAGNVPVIEKNPDTGEEFFYNNGVPLVTGRGNLAFIDIFKSESNYNFTVIATSGAGKSFFANDLIRDVLSRGGFVFTFDMGGSYKDICSLMGGSNLEFDISNPISINHFWGIDKELDYNEMQPILVGSVLAMAFESGSPTAIETSETENILLSAWKKYGTKLGVKEICDEAKDMADQLTSDGQSNQASVLYNIHRQLLTYAVGPTAVWFNGPPNLDLSNPFTILELNELENNPSLKTVVFTTIIALVSRRIYSSDRKVPKILLIDEAWSLLDNDRAGPFIEKAFRTIRKFFGAAGIITQSCADINISTASKAAFNNSAWRFFLLQKSSSVTFAKEEQLINTGSDHVFEVMSSLRRRDNFSEIMVEHDGLYAPFRYFVDGYSAFTYSSKAQDNARLEKIEKQYGIGRDEAIEIAAGLKDIKDLKKRVANV